MSLETALAENTAALQLLVRTLRENATAAAAAAIDTAKASAAAEPEKTASTSAPSAEAADTPSSASTAAAPTYEEAAAAVKSVVKAKGRDAGVAVLHSFNSGAATLKDIAPAQFAAVIAACQEALQ